MKRGRGGWRWSAAALLAVLGVIGLALASGCGGSDADATGSRPPAGAERTASQSGGAAKPAADPALPASQLAGERVVLGMEATEVTPELRRAIHAGDVAGVVLYAKNFPTNEAGARLIRRLQAIPRPPGLRDPLLVIVDQEGGEVMRVQGAPYASAEEMGERGPGYSRRQGKLTAATLRRVGVNVDLAPVLDVGRPGGDIAETHRAFGDTAAKVARVGVPFGEGLEAGGIVAAAKHFPGVGSLRENTDVSAREVDFSKAKLRRVDEAPYAPFIAGGGRMVMLSTAIYPAYSKQPAAFSRALVTGELRGRLGFDGVAITDALETTAAQSFGDPGQAAVAAAAAGADLTLFQTLGGAEEAHRALFAALRSGRLDRGEFEASAQRVLNLRATLPGQLGAEPRD